MSNRPDELIPVMPRSPAERPGWLDRQYEQLETEFQEIMHGDHPWLPCKQTRDVCMKKMKGVRDNHVFRVEFTVNCSVQRLSHRVHAYSPYRRHYHNWIDHDRTEQLEIVDFDKGRILVREVCKPLLMGLVSAREGLVIAVSDAIPTGRRVMYKSIEHPDYPPLDKTIRCTTLAAGVIMQHTNDPDVTRVTLIDDSDLRLSYLPAYVIETVTPKCVMLGVTEMSKSADVPDIAHDPLPGTP